MTNLIVGLDPGTTVGLAILDLNGGIKHVSSYRNISISEIIRIINSHGKPAVIACDKAQPPDAVRKIAAACNVKLFHPDQDLPISKKRDLAEKYNNDHERDALASAVYAYNNLQNKLRWAETQVMRSLDDIKADVIRGSKLADIISKKFAGDESERDEITALKKELQKLKRRASQDAGESSRLIIRDFASEEIGEAQNLLRGLLNNQLILLRPVNSLRYKDLTGSRIKAQDVVYALSSQSDENGISLLERTGVTALIASREIDTPLPQLRPIAMEIKQLFGFYYIEKKAFNDAIKKAPLSAARAEKIIKEYKRSK